ncbi:antibiotic biosynthesis monooxygenase [Streptomyces sp. NPDC006339]|uniref:antibiotic biosynthesis monooxygenase n=1 Tax=Streptomyces sp. NPDC006339 TaxID=3156755 RepID=UPI0033B9F6B9
MDTIENPHARPDLRHPGVGLVLASRWRVGTPERQRATVRAIRRAWRSRDWPDAGLLSYSVFVGSDGDTLLHHSQWTSEERYRDFVRTQRDGRNAEIDAAVPGIERVGLRRLAPPFRTTVYEAEGREAAVPGCVAVSLVEIGPEGPDALADALEAAGAEGGGDGRIAAYAHLTTDGTHLFHYAEWESETAHVRRQAETGAFAGIADDRTRRYAPALSLSAGA